MSNFISCYDPKTEELNHYEVTYAVYIYVRQLEQYVKYPKTSKLIQAYSFRFQEDE